MGWFWSYAKAVIYKGKVFNAEAERQAKNAIWFGVFGVFSTGEPADWEKWRPGLQRRIELAGAWLARNPNCYPAAPYAEVRAGCGYFDAGNDKGFARTLGWWRTELAKRQQGAVERALDEALTELHQRRRLDAGQHRVPASRPRPPKGPAGAAPLPPHQAGPPRRRRRAAAPSRPPASFTLRYDEVAALLVILPSAPAAGAAWGEVHRASLNLERFIAFDD